MKISAQTLKLLENYTTINQGIFIPKTMGEATELKTCDLQKKMQAKSIIPEKFENDVCLGDLKAFLSVLSGMKNPEVEFNDNHLVVRDEDGNTNVKMTYADQRNVIFMEKSIKLENSNVQFELKEKTISKLLEFAAILRLNDLRLYAKGGSLFFQALDRDNPDSNKFEVEVSKSVEGEHDYMFKAEHIKLIPGDYVVNVNSKGASFRSAAHNTLEYIIAQSNVKKA
jgi:hypothetical protein